MKSVVQFEHVCVRRHGRNTLHDVSFSIGPGECVAVIGANGSGKTTLLRTIMGFLPVRSGKITRFGQPAASPSSFRKQIGWVPQSLAIDFSMPLTVRDTVLMGRLAHTRAGRPFSREDRDAADKALREAGIADLAARPIGHLSGGELQKTHIARALCQSPRLLLLDEPTGNLDLGAQRDCFDLIGALRRNRQLAILIVMHDLRSIPDYCARAMMVDEGALVFDGPIQEVFTEDNLAHIYKRQSPTVRAKLLDELAGKGDRP